MGEPKLLGRNVPIVDEKGFKGEWVAVPREDFDAARAALRSDSPVSRPLEGGWAIERGVTCVVCPDCAFAFDAIHEDEPNGGYSCPCCHPPLPEGAIPVEVVDVGTHEDGSDFYASFTIICEDETLDEIDDLPRYAYLVKRNPKDAHADD